MTGSGVLGSLGSLHENDALIARVAARWRTGSIWVQPGRRRLILSVLGAAIAAITVGRRGSAVSQLGGFGSAFEIVLATVAFLGILYLLFRWGESDRLRPGQLLLHTALWIALCTISKAAPEGGFRRVTLLVLLTLCFTIWRCGYMLLSVGQKRAERNTFRDHLFYLSPVWGGTEVPTGKGLAYLERREARDPPGLARSQLAGLKLLILAVCWFGAAWVMDRFVFASGTVVTGPCAVAAPIPRLEDLLNGQRQTSLGLAWLSLYAQLIRTTLEIAMVGHVYVGVLRLCGYNVFRNTYKPLAARSLVDFWGRYYYYFKELLIDFFFLPTYLRAFRKHPRLRMFAAVTSAAFLGNLYFHLLLEMPRLVNGDLHGAWTKLHAYPVFCTFLTLGIYVSMLRQRRHRGARPEGGFATGRLIALRNMAGVWTFFALIQVWDLGFGDPSIAQRARFFLALFGVHGVFSQG